MARTLLPTVALFATLATASQAKAEAAVVPLKLSVEASCTDEADFTARLGQRSQRIVVGSEARADMVAIAIRQSTAGWDGTLTITGKDGDSVRRMTGGSCNEVTDALSLAVALTYDPDALSMKPAAAPAPPTSITAAPLVPERQTAPPPPPPAKPPLHFTMGLLGSVQGSRPLPIGATAFGEVATASGASGRLAFGVQRGSIDVGDASARFTWAYVAPDLSPVRLVRGAFSLAPCAGLSFGVLSAEPDGIPGGESYARAWIAPRPILRMRWSLGAISIEAQGAVDIPLIRGRYTFGAVTAYAIPIVVPQVGLGIAYDLR